MVCFDDVAMLQVGDGAGKLEDAMEGTTGEMKLLHGGRLLNFSAMCLLMENQRLWETK